MMCAWCGVRCDVCVASYVLCLCVCCALRFCVLWCVLCLMRCDVYCACLRLNGLWFVVVCGMRCAVRAAYYVSCLCVVCVMVRCLVVCFVLSVL